MMLFSKIVSTCLGIGYVRKGAGTLSAFITCLGWYLLLYHANISTQLALALVLLLLGAWTASRVESVWGEDSNRVVIDEAAGMCISLIGLPFTWMYGAGAFVLFRFFDIAKPLYIRRMENIKGGWGVMMDDVLAGLYSNILMQAVVYTAGAKSMI